jgi:hypothetical protein
LVRATLPFLLIEPDTTGLHKWWRPKTMMITGVPPPLTLTDSMWTIE